MTHHKVKRLLMVPAPLVDPHGRPFRSFRVSVNRACNLRCTYCHWEGGAMAGGGITAAEFGRLGRIAAELGATTVKVTGGEPTLRNDITAVIGALRPHFGEVSMTTNGTTLERLAVPMAAAGLDRVNVSIDTLDVERYRHITQGGDVDVVIRGIEAARDAGLGPVKLNMVIMRGFNEDDVAEMEAFAAQVGAHLQLIELHTDRDDAFGVQFRESFVSLDAIEADLQQRADRIDTAPQHARPRYVFDTVRHQMAEDGEVGALPGHYVEVVRPWANAGFCADCHRLRLTGDGLLKPCLMRTDNHVDVLGPMRDGADDAALKALFVEANARREPYWAGHTPELPSSSGLPGLRVLS